MKKHDETKEIETVEKSSDASREAETEQTPDLNERIYNFLDKLEDIAIKAAKINAVVRNYRIKSLKKQKKKNKKIGKINKKTGAVKLKKQKRAKKAKALKRYTEKKK